MPSVNPGPSSSTSSNTSAVLGSTTAMSQSAEALGASPNAVGSTNTLALNTALSRGGVVTLNQAGTYNLDASTTVLRSSGLTYQVCLVIPSYTTFRIGAGVILRALNGLNNVALIQNSNVSGGNVSIAIEGGIWDGNGAGTTRTDIAATDFACMAFWLQNITDLRLTNITMLDPHAWGIGIGGCYRVRAENTTFIYTQAVILNQGGFQFEGPNSDVMVRNTMGNTYDDLVAFVTEAGALYANTLAGQGPMNDILVDGVTSDLNTGCLHLVRLQDSTTNPITRATVRNLSGPYTDGAVILGGGGLTPKLKNILIDGVYCSPLTGKNPGNATISVSNGFDSVTIQNVERIYADTAETTKRNTIQISGGACGYLKVHNMNVDDQCAAAANVAFISINSNSMSVFLADNLTAQSIVNINTDALIEITASGRSVARMLVSNVGLGRIAQVFRLTSGASITNIAAFSNVYSVLNSAVAFLQTGAGTMPNLSLSNVRLDNTQGGALGCISFSGLTGTCLIQAANCSFNNGANVNLVRAGSEVIRVQSTSLPVPKAILTAAEGDIVLDSATNNDPFRCSVAPSTFVAL